MPERWLGEGKRLEKYLVSFSKGSRQCVGLNPAHAELRLILYSVFGPGGVEVKLFETDETDMNFGRRFGKFAVRPVCPRLPAAPARNRAPHPSGRGGSLIFK